MFENNSFPVVDETGILERVSRFKARSIKGPSKVQALRMALSMIDLTTLEGSDTPSKVRQLCYKALHLHDDLPGLPTVAAVCVYPTLVRTAKNALQGSDVKVASVSTYFPSGQATGALKLAETRFALEEGADEIDMVISRGLFLQGEYTAVYDEIAAVKDLCRQFKAGLKVILETGELGPLDQVRKACEIALKAGPDFLKTSTGKIAAAANMAVTLVMLQAIRDHFLKTGMRVGMKPAGGISDAKTALHYLVMVKETVGEEWLHPALFRFGASRLANDLLRQIMKEHSGKYQDSNYFSKD